MLIVNNKFWTSLGHPHREVSFARCLQLMFQSTQERSAPFCSQHIPPIEVSTLTRNWVVYIAASGCISPYHIRKAPWVVAWGKPLRFVWTADLPQPTLRMQYGHGSKSKARTPSEHQPPTTKISVLKWVVNLPTNQNVQSRPFGFPCLVQF